MKVLSYDQLLYFWSKLKTTFVFQEDGKGLSANDYTTDEKNKLAGIEAGANKTVVDSALSSTSTNPVQNKAVKTALDGKAASSHTHAIADITNLQTTLDGKAASSHTHAISDITNLQTTLNAKVETSLVGKASGIATLDSNGLVPSSQLPSYVDDVLEGYLYNGKFYKETAHTNEITAEGGKIYVDLTTNYSYRWSGSTYVKIESVDIELITNTEIDAILAS
ncbi:MAG: hypothetical protein ACI4NM_00930 [Bullifex sp.]